MENKVTLHNAVIFHFAITKNDRVYIFQVTPGSPWNEIQEVFDELKSEFKKLEADALRQAEDKKLQEEMANAQAEASQ